MESRRRNCKPFSLGRSQGAPITEAPPKSSRLSCDLLPDSIRRKKVKFAESATVMEKISDHASPSFQSRKSQPPAFEAPKTSEYKIYKEIQDKTSSKRQNCQLSLEKIHKNVSEEKYIMQEFGESVKFKNSISRSLLPILDSAPVIHALPFSSGYMSLSYEECENGSIFSKKRSRLLQLVAEPFSQGKDRLDLISELLKRLGIEKNSLLCCEELLTPAQNMSYDRIQSPACLFDVENKMIATKFVASATKKHLRKDLPSDKWLVDYDDDLRRASWNHAYFQTIPNWSGPENSFVHNNQISLELLSAVDSELHDYVMPNPIRQWIPNSNYNKGSRILGDSSSSRKSDYKNLIELPSCHSTEQSLVPYTKAKCLELFDPQNMEVQTCFPSLGWKEKTREPEQGLASYTMAHPASDHFSESFFSAWGLLGETKSRYGRDDIYNSLLADNCKMMIEDASTCYLDVLQSNPEGAPELGGKTIPLDFVTDCHISSHKEIQLCKDRIEDISCLIYSGKDDVAGEILLESQITILASPFLYS